MIFQPLRRVFRKQTTFPFESTIRFTNVPALAIENQILSSHFMVPVTQF